MAVESAERVRWYRRIHASLKRMDLDDDGYRELLLNRFGVLSKTALDMDGLQEFCAVLNGRRARGGSSRKASGRYHGKRQYSWQKKATALWITAYQLGLVRDREDRGLDRFVERQTGIASVRFLPPYKMASVVEALKDMCARDGGVVWQDDKDPVECVLVAQKRLMQEAGIGDKFCSDGQKGINKNGGYIRRWRRFDG